MDPRVTTAPYTMFTPTQASERLREALTPRTPEQIAEEERRRRLAREAMEGLLTQRPDMTGARTLRPMTIGPAVARATPEYTMGDIAGEMAVQPFSSAANLVTRVGEGAARTVGAGRIADSLRDRRQLINEATAPVTGAGIATRVATDIGASALPYVASGIGALGLLRSAGLTAVESRADDGSLVKGLADLTGSDALQQLAASPYRTATDVGVDVALNIIPGAKQTARTLMQGVPEATQGLRGTQRVARSLQQVMGNAARETATAVRQNPRTALATAAAVAGDVVAPGVGTALAAAMPALPRSAFAETLQSRLGRAIESAPFERGTPQQWRALLSKGVAAGEREFTGIDDFLNNATAPTLTKAEVQQAFENGRIELGETVASDNTETLRDELFDRIYDRRLAVAKELESSANMSGLYQQVQDAERAYQYAVADQGALRQQPPSSEAGPDAMAQWWAAVSSSGKMVEAARGRKNQAIDAMTAARAEIDRAVAADPEIQQLNAQVEDLRRPKYRQYTQPGMPENYREVVLTLNNRVPAESAEEVARLQAERSELFGRHGSIANFPEEDVRRLDAANRRLHEINSGMFGGDNPNTFKHGHWDDVENPLAHLRLSDRTTESGERTLFVEELQSDWHQQGREPGRGYRPRGEAPSTPPGTPVWSPEYDNRVPDAPFKRTPEWVELGLKRALDEAVRGGYDRVAFVTGSQAAKNFGVGAEGMQGFYDRILPSTIRDYAKTLGVRLDIEPATMSNGGVNPSFRITPEVRDRVSMGQRLISPLLTAGSTAAAAGAFSDEENRGDVMLAGGLFGATGGKGKKGVKGAAVAARPARTIAQLAAAVPALVKDNKVAKMAKSLKVDAPAVVGRIARSAKQMYPALARVPKATEESATRKAVGNAVRQIQYDDIDRPTTISNYGELEPATFEDSPVARFTNTPEAMRANADRAMEFLRTADREPWTPREFAFPRGPIQDALYGWPGQQQTAFPRWETQDPQIRSMMEEIYTDPVNRDLIKQQIERGLPFGGETFYPSLYPVYQVAQEAGIPPEQVMHWIEATAPASARNSIINENAAGNFLMNLRNRGMELDEATVRREMDAFKRRFGVGLPLMPVHRQGVSNVLEGQSLRDILTRPVRIASQAPEYKIPTYGVQKTGDFAKSWVGDVHEATGETIGSRFHPFFANQGGFDPNQYGLAEGFMQGIANEMGLPLGTAQAGRWFGGGELTGLVSPRGDALDILEKQVAYTLNGLGQEVTPRSVRDYTLNLIREGGILLPWFSGKTPMPDMRFNVR